MVERRERLTVPAGGKKVSAVLSLPVGGIENAPAMIVLAHGAGNDMEHPLLVALAEGLAARGFLAVRFNFPYREAGRKTPDPVPRLESTWLEVTDALRERLEGLKLPLIVGGKSLGGRVAAQLVSDDVLQADGLIFFGYPLHRAGDTELRDAPLRGLRHPLLFLTGTRDRQCRLDFLRTVCAELPAEPTLHVVEDGDHSLDVPGRDRETVYTGLLDVTCTWMKKALRKPARRK